MSVAADYYDGQTSQRRAVTLSSSGEWVTVAGEGVRRTARIDELAVSEVLGSAPRILRFRDGAFCEVRDLAGLSELLARAGHRESAVERWQRSVPIAVFSTFAVVVALAAAYFIGLPWAAEQVAQRLPPSVDEALSRRTLETLESGLLKRSALPVERRAQLSKAFRKLERPGGRIGQLRLRFGEIPQFGANAFALPDGTVVLLDDLVKLCDHDEQIYAVLAHELGHVASRHGERLLLQGTGVGMLTAWWFGDLSGLLTAAPAALLQARYSREFESQADAYAVKMLRANGIAPSRLAEALEKLVAAHAAETPAPGWADYLSSHPAPRERIEALRAQ